MTSNAAQWFCRWFGHKLLDHSIGNDYITGEPIMNCTRCGWCGSLNEHAADLEESCLPDVHRPKLRRPERFSRS